MLDVQTRNLMTEALYEATRKEYILPSFKCVKIIYEGTMASSNPVRLWIVDLVTNCATPDFFNGMEDTTPKEFLREFAQQVLKSRVRQRPRKTTKWMSTWRVRTSSRIGKQSRLQ
jgi:hypothetical protein